jgi:hypothetical protein
VVQAVAAAPEYRPVVQAVQVDAPVSAAYLPARQLEQVEPPTVAR